MRGAAEDCQQQGLAFVPLVAESLGGWHDSALAHIRKLGTALALHTGQSDGEASSHLWRRLSILLQKGNSSMLGDRVNSLPSREGLPDIYGIFWKNKTFYLSIISNFLTSLKS